MEVAARRPRLQPEYRMLAPLVFAPGPEAAGLHPPRWRRRLRACARAPDVAQAESEDVLRTRLAARSRVRRLGVGAGGVLACAGLAALGVSHWETLRLFAAPTCALVVACSVLLRAEVDRAGRLHFSARPPILRKLHGRAQCVVVRDTGDERGRGAFAVSDIPRGSMLGFYEGELLDSAAFLTRYAGARPEYAIAVDGQYVLDGAERAKGASFTPAHMNHAQGQQANVGRLHQWRRRRVMFFTKRDVREGEELCFDYGRAFWKGKEGDIL